VKRDEVLKTLSEHRAELNRHGVKSIALFGSVARGEDSARSDVDILVELDHLRHRIGLFAFIRLRHRLEEMLGTQVDLVTPKALKRQLKDQILKEAIYAG
jgi:predicted nucleotidyltransferase